MTRVTAILPSVQKEQRQLSVPMWKIKLFAPEVQKPSKFYYMGPMFRYERPQAGRLRQFHQIGVECFGSSNPATDVETIAMAAHFLKKLVSKVSNCTSTLLEILRAVQPIVRP